MDISIERYFRDAEEDGLRTFCSYGKIGIHHIKSDRKTMPSFDRIITSTKYIFVEIDELWGVLDKDLCFIIPPKYKSIYPVKLVDREAFISMCLNKTKDTADVFHADCNRPTHVAIQKANIRHYGRARLLLPGEDEIYDDNNNLKEENKATLYEIDYEYEQITTTLFVLTSKNSSCLVDLSNDKIQTEDSKEFSLLWHYKDNSFIFRNNDSSFGFSSYWEGRFHKETLISPNQGTGSITYSPKLIFHRNGFVSVCLPDVNKHIGNTTYKNEKLSISGKWALFRLAHRKGGLKNYWKEKVDSYFKQLTPFAFTEPLSQMRDGFVFKCSEFGKEWLIKYDSDEEWSKSAIHITDDDTEKAVALVDEYMHSGYKSSVLDDYIGLCFKGNFSVSSPIFDSIEAREDDMYDFTTDNGYGLCDENMQIIVPAKYDYPIEQIAQFMIVSKNGKYGVINDDAEEIVPCVYTSIKIGTGRISVWNYSSEYDDFSGDWKSQTYIGNQCDIPNNHEEKMGDLFIVGINAEIKESNGIFSNLLKLRQIPNYYLNRKVTGSLCDIYLPTGEMITHFSRIPQGGIEYSKEYDTVTSYERIAYSQDEGEYLEGIQLYFIKEQKTTPKYAQIKMLNKRAFLAFDYCHVGIASNGSDDKTNFPWVVPAIYVKISFPVNNIIYAWKWKDNKTIIDIYDLTLNYKLVSSMEYIDGSLPLVNEETKEDQSARFINLDEIDNIKYFPYEEYHESDAYDSSSGDLYENDLRDAFEDDPEAMWGRLD